MVATDLDVRWLEQRLRAPNIEIRRHNVVDDSLPDAPSTSSTNDSSSCTFASARRRSRRLVSAVRPGGWLLLEDFDSDIAPDAFPAPQSDDEELGNSMMRSVRSLLTQRGADTALGHKLPQLLRDAGLEDVGADAYQAIEAGDAVRQLQRANIAEVADALVGQALVTRDELERYLTLLDERRISPSSPLLVSAWGRRPRV